MSKRKPNWTDREKVVLLEEYEKCNVIIIKIVINNNSFFERSFCASTVKFNADFTKGISY
jgi:hypothetical protein